MAIDAVIGSIERDGNDLRLSLVPRKDKRGWWSIPGQGELIILDFAHIPNRGQAIWGGSDSVIIEPDEHIPYQTHYRREGYRRLREAGSKARDT